MSSVTPPKLPHKNTEEKTAERRRRPSGGRGGANLKFKNSVRDAKLFHDQKLPPLSQVAKQLDMPLEDIKKIIGPKLQRLRALAGAEESEYVGPSGLVARVVSDLVNKDKVEDAAKVLNAPFLGFDNEPTEMDENDEMEVVDKQTVEQLLRHRRPTRLKTTSMDPVDRRPTRLRPTRLNPVETDVETKSNPGETKSNPGETTTINADQIAATTKMIQHLDQVIKAAPNCSHKEQFKKGTKKEQREKLRQELVSLADPNVEIQEEMEISLIEKREQDAMIRIQFPQQFQNLERVVQELLEGQQRADQDRELLENMQIKMKRQNKAFHEKQMEYAGKALDLLAKIDYSTDVRYTREVNIYNLYGITWLIGDVMSTFTSLFIDGQNNFSPSLKRSLKQGLTTTVTLIEVAMKWVTTFFDELYSFYSCFKAHPVSCIVAKLIQYAAVALAAALVYFALGEMGAIGAIVKDIVIAMGNAIWWAGASLYSVGEYMIGNTLGLAFKHIGKLAQEMGEGMKSWFAEQFPSVVAFLTTVTNGMSSIVATLKAAWSSIKSLGDMGTGAMGSMRDWLPSWNYVGDALMGPTFKQLLIADNLAFQQATFKQFLITDNLAFQITVEDTTRNEETTRNKPPTRNKPYFKQLKF